MLSSLELTSYCGLLQHIDLMKRKLTLFVLILNAACYSDSRSALRWSFEDEPCTQDVRNLSSGFVVTSGDVNVVGKGCDTPDFKLPTRAVDLDGFGASVIETEQVFEPGEYDLQFALAGHPFRPGTALVEFGGFAKRYRRSERQPFVTEHEHATVNRPSKLRLTFSGHGDGANAADGGPTLDDVVVVRTN